MTVCLKFGQSKIIVILKPLKDAMPVGSYHPISLFNLDYKKLTSILENRLKAIIGKNISPDQTGFIPDHSWTTCIWKIINLINVIKKGKTDSDFVFLDTEKAFDRVEHRFLLGALAAFGFGENLIYSQSFTKVGINVCLCPNIDITREVSWGCPLSALLVTILLEPLAISVRD